MEYLLSKRRNWLDAIWYFLAILTITSYILPHVVGVGIGHDGFLRVFRQVELGLIALAPICAFGRLYIMISSIRRKEDLTHRSSLRVSPKGKTAPVLLHGKAASEVEAKAEVKFVLPHEPDFETAEHT
mmetsp:Transcript_87598/g.152940  ORF Transcript_87598/g.152940 Transcript_87598/m.152940 type:complete len:128 (+) Transcript_87598:3-386(+)